MVMRTSARCASCGQQGAEFTAPGFGGTPHRCIGEWESSGHNHYCATCVAARRVPQMRVGDVVSDRPIEAWTDSREYRWLSAMPTYRQVNLR